jgi:hypothetical protein
MKSKDSVHTSLCSAFLCGVACVLIFLSPAQAEQNKLTIENNTPLPLKISLGRYEDTPDVCLGYVDPISRETMDVDRGIGRWYIMVQPFTTGTRDYRTHISTLYLRQGQHSYVLEVMESDFSDSPILPDEDVSLEGIWQGMQGLQVQFTKSSGVYIGSLVSVPDFMRNRGYYTGMEVIRVNRTGFSSYRGVTKGLRPDGSYTEDPVSCLIEGGTRLNPQGWVRMGSNQIEPPDGRDQQSVDISGTWSSNIDNQYIIRQTGTSFSWTVPGHKEVAQGTINGRNVSAKWGEGGRWNGEGTGTIEVIDGQGRATKIVWSNGAVFHR